MTSKAAECRRIIARASKSFAMASRLLSPRVRDEAVALYAWCRRCDDAVDVASPAAQPAALNRLREELDALLAGQPTEDLVLGAFQEVAAARSIPPIYPRELLAGMEMDVANERYETLDQLLLYSYRVAGVVGLMMCHVLGVADDEALPHACHLGVAMQLTNIARDVAEDWERGRLYLPREWIEADFVHPADGGVLQTRVAELLKPAVRQLLDLADRYYQSGDGGLQYLDARSAVSIRTARAVYSAIGKRIRAADCDVLRGRAYVSTTGKLGLAGVSVLKSIADSLRRLAAGRVEYAPPSVVLPFADMPRL